jgi:leucyl/phenylalanyl-tRNA--protein transferase
MVSQNDLVAVGGDLSPERLLSAYSHGIFPWYSDGEPILWWSPDPRMVVRPVNVHISRSMDRMLKRRAYRVTFDEAFAEVIEACRRLRLEDPGTWITAEMRQAYIELHHLGFAHSVEVWRREELVGGLYGVSLGKCFFGESMFHLAPNASKYAFITMCRKLAEWGFELVDCQVPSDYLRTLGATEIPAPEYLELLEENLGFNTHVGNWDLSDAGPLEW